MILLIAGVQQLDENGARLVIDIDNNTAIQVAKVLLACVGCAAVVSVFYIYLAKRFARVLIIATFVLNMLMWAAFGVFLLLQQQTFGGILMLLFAGVYILFFWWWRNRIPFATACLQTVAMILLEYPHYVISCLV